MKAIKWRHLPFLLLTATFTAWSPPTPRIFLIGDSISIQYGPYLREFLQGTATLERKEDNGEAAENLNIPKGANGGDSRMVLAYLRQMVQKEDFDPDYLLLNCGLHDIKTPIGGGERQVDEREYADNLSTIIALAQRKRIQLIWMRTTPVVDSIHNHEKNTWMHRFARDVERYNQIADSLFTAQEIPIIDLHGFTKNLGNDRFMDHVHYDEETRRLQGAFIAGFINSYLLREQAR